MESSFIIWEENKNKKVSKNIWLIGSRTLTAHTHIHMHTHTLSLSLSLTLTHTHTHTPQDTKHHKQALHETWDKYKLIRLTIKLHTVHHTTEDLITQSADGVHPGGEKSFQRTLAVKQQPGVSPPLGGSSPRKNTDFMIFNVTERGCSILDQWLLRTVPQGKEESRFFLFSIERFLVSTVTVSQGVVTVSECAEAGKAWQKKILRPQVWNKCCGLPLEWYRTFLNTAADCENEVKGIARHFGKYTYLLSWESDEQIDTTLISAC